MFKQLTITALFTLLMTTVNAQEIAVLDINKILEAMPEYSQAQKELDRITAEWNQEINQEYDKVKSMYNKYQAEQVLLSDEARRQSEEEIMLKEKEVMELQKKRFGPDGQLFERRQQLINPVQDKVYAAIEEYADDKGIDIIFDKNSSTGLIFTSERYDKTADILKKLGLQ